MWKRILKIVLLVVLAMVVAGFIGVRVAVSHLQAHYFDDYDPSLPFNAQVAEHTEKDGYDLEKVYFESRAGEKVPTLITFPPHHGGKLPLILFLHGIGQKKDFIEDICRPFNANGFAMACFDQATKGERKLPPGSPLTAQIGATISRPWKTVNDARRFFDYAATRDDIDMNRIYLVGASYGAITGSTVAAFDKRVRAVALVYGGGNLPVLLDSRMNRTVVRQTHPGLEWMLTPLYTVVAYVLDPMDPIRYIARIAPRPLLMQNGKDDSMIPTAASQALQAAAGDPKKIILYDGDHIGLDAHTVAAVLHDDLDWLLEQDKEFRGGSAAESPETGHAFAAMEEKVKGMAK